MAAAPINVPIAHPKDVYKRQGLYPKGFLGVCWDMVVLFSLGAFSFLFCYFGYNRTGMFCHHPQGFGNLLFLFWCKAFHQLVFPVVTGCVYAFQNLSLIHI